MSKIRRSIVAGVYYEDDPQKLKKDILKFLLNAESDAAELPGLLTGVIVPHAGYVYSGQAAAYAYTRLKKRNFRRAVIIAPSHHVGGFYFSIGDFDFYQTPLGNIEVCRDSVEKLLKEEYFEFSTFAHLREHALEVQLPFLQIINPDVKIIPIVMGDQHLDNSRYLAEVLLKHFGDDLANTVFIISSDLSHYHDAATADKKDNRFIELILQNDSDTIFKEIEERKIEACGFGGILTLLKIADMLGDCKHKMFHYYNSGEIKKDFRQVVGYYAGGIYCNIKNSNKKASFVKESSILNQAQKEFLLDLAKKTIESNFNPEVKIPASPDDEVFKQKCGIFVTLHKNGGLRGCIGYVSGVKPLYKAVQEMAYAAAFKDPRFSPLMAGEAGNIDIEISVLSPLQKINGIDDFEVGKDGLYLQHPYASGLLLPQVATEQGWSKKEFLVAVCRKAGLSEDFLNQDDTTLFKFSAQIF